MAKEKEFDCDRHTWSGEGNCPFCQVRPGSIAYVDDGEETSFPIRKSGMRHIATLPEGEKCVGMVVFNDRVIVAFTYGVFFLNPDGKLEPIEFVSDAFDHMETCEHGKGLTD